jgi:predicted regulator of Ras-like GTPase activity (Roadblock/LC7/MglB family)
MDGPALVQSLRQSKPGLRIMLIPLFGEELAGDELSFEVQGVLPKPFFMGDLPNLIREALTCPFGDETVPVIEIPSEAPPKTRLEPPPAPKAVSRKQAAAPRDVDGILEELFREIRAQAVLFTQGSKLIAHAGNVTQESAQDLATLTAESLSAIHKIAAFLGETDDRFEQCTFEGNECNVYSMNVTPDTILAVALSARTPVGMVRYNLRRAADALAETWSD